MLSAAPCILTLGSAQSPALCFGFEKPDCGEWDPKESHLSRQELTSGMCQEQGGLRQWLWCCVLSYGTIHAQETSPGGCMEKPPA